MKTTTIAIDLAKSVLVLPQGGYGVANRIVGILERTGGIVLCLRPVGVQVQSAIVIDDGDAKAVQPTRSSQEISIE